MLPTCTLLKSSGEATLTIESDQEMPFEFTLETTNGKDDNPLMLDCKIIVRNKVGRFLTGSTSNMSYYGFRQTPVTQFPRRLVVDVVSKHGEIVKHETANATYQILPSPNSPLNKIVRVSAK